MANIVVEKTPAARRLQDWSVSAAIRALLRTRREVLKLSMQARRERRHCGYAHVPQRVWDRHSALLLLSLRGDEAISRLCRHPEGIAAPLP